MGKIKLGTVVVKNCDELHYAILSNPFCGNITVKGTFHGHYDLFCWKWLKNTCGIAAKQFHNTERKKSIQLIIEKKNSWFVQAKYGM